VCKQVTAIAAITTSIGLLLHGKNYKTQSLKLMQLNYSFLFLKRQITNLISNLQVNLIHIKDHKTMK
jgi:hypothetical protein